MGIMVHSLLWVMQDFVHQPDHGSQQIVCVDKLVASASDVHPSRLHVGTHGTDIELRRESP